MDAFHALWIYSVVLITPRLAVRSKELAGVTFDLGTREKDSLVCLSRFIYFLHDSYITPSYQLPAYVHLLSLLPFMPLQMYFTSSRVANSKIHVFVYFCL